MQLGSQLTTSAASPAGAVTRFGMPSCKDDQADWAPYIVDLAADAIIVTGWANQILVFNCAAEAMFGYRAADIAGRSVHSLIPAWDTLKWPSACNELDARLSTIRASDEVIAHRQDGTSFVAEVSIAAARPDAERGQILILRNISERKQAEVAAAAASLVGPAYAAAHTCL